MTRARLSPLLLFGLSMAFTSARTPVTPCGIHPDRVQHLAPGQGQQISSMSVAPAREPGPLVDALALASVDETSGGPSVQVRFVASAGTTSLSQRWSWLVDASAQLGPGQTPCISTLPGDSVRWLVIMAREEKLHTRPVAVVIQADPQARRLVLHSETLDAADHVFGPLALHSDGRASILWGATEGDRDRIHRMNWPPGPEPEHQTLVSGNLEPGFAASFTEDTMVLAWLEHEEGSKALALGLAGYSEDGQPILGPVSAGRFEAPARILDLGTHASGLALLALAQDPLDETPFLVTSNMDLEDVTISKIPSHEILPATTAAGAILETGEGVVATLDELGQSPLIEVTSGGASWVVGGADVVPPLTMAAVPGGVLLAWTEATPAGTSRLSIARQDLDDADGDDIPDGVDLCPLISVSGSQQRDHDGCPDATSQTSVLRDHEMAWLPLMADQIPCMGLCAAASAGDGALLLGSCLEGQSLIIDAHGKSIPLDLSDAPVLDALSIEGRGWIVATAGSVLNVDREGKVTGVDVGSPGDDEPRINALARTADGNALVLTARGAAELDSGTLEVHRWLGEGQDVVDATDHPTLGLMILTSTGRILTHGPGKKKTKPIEPPPSMHEGERAVGLAVGGTTVYLALSSSGVFSRQGGADPWVEESLDATTATHASITSMAATSSGEIILTTGDGYVMRRSDSGWHLVPCGLDGTWVRRLVARGPDSSPLAIAIDGRPRVLGLLAVQSMIVVDASYFPESGSQLHEKIADLLGPVLEAIVDGPVHVLVQGHTDSSGSQETNLALSLRRAQKVRKWLVDAGADPARILAVGYGEGFPVLEDPADLENRRVELYLLSP